MSEFDQTISTSSGTVLGFAQYGDPKGKPVFIFHGWPSSRLSAKIYDDVGKKLHIRVIAPDRPGYGLSDFQEGRTMLDWPDDVIALANHLKIKTFAVMGVSGGGPYAAACAYKIPKRLTRVGIAVGLGPIFDDHMLEGMMWLSKIGWANFGRFPIVRRLSSIIQYCYAWYSPGLDLYRMLFGAKSDRKLFEDPALKLRTKRNMQEAFRQGIRGPEYDLKLYTTDWGFDLKDIRAKTFLWYGADDQNVSLNMGKYYASKIRGSKLKVYPGEGHLVPVTHAKEIFIALTR
jgi:pimeloyl-ACP methyl ester carboxylesterase